MSEKIQIILSSTSEQLNAVVQETIQDAIKQAEQKFDGILSSQRNRNVWHLAEYYLIGTDGKYATVTGSGNGSAIELQPFDAAKNQRWLLLAREDKTFVVWNSKTAKSMDLSGALGSPVHGWEYHGNSNQKFKIVDDGNGLFSFILNVNSTDVAVQVNGDAFGSDAPNNSVNQKFELRPTGRSFGKRPVVFVNDTGDNFALSIDSNNNGTKFRLQPLLYNSQQSFLIRPHEDGWDIILPLMYQNKALDAASGTGIHLWDTHREANQQWRLIPVGPSLFRVQSKAFQQNVLTASGGTVKGNQEIILGQAVNQQHQHYQIRYVEEL